MPAVMVREIRFTAPEVIARFVRDLEDPEASNTVTPQEARESLIGYCRYKTKGFYQAYPHLRLLVEKLEAVERGEITRLIIWMPPQHGKSHTATESFPDWYLGKHPDKRVAISSYAAELAEGFGRKNRDDMVEFGEELWGVQVATGSKAAARWDIAGRRGGMVAVGVGGALTGRGANLLVIDDPFKDWAEAQSPAARAKVWDWYRSVARTRVRKGGAIVIIQTRWHDADLSGRLVSEMQAGTGEQWDILHIPCEAEEHDPLGRAPGQPLCPELGFDAEWMAATKMAVGAYVWAALYQGRPTPLEGGIWKRHWWRYWKPQGVKLPPITVRLPSGETTLVEAEELPDAFDLMLQSWDMTFKDTRGSDYVAGGVWGALGARRYLLDLVNERMEFTRSCQAVRDMRMKWPLAYAILIEDKANGPAVISTLRDEVGGIIPVEPQGGKQARAHAVSPFVQAGNVYLPHPLIAAWVEMFLLQASSFPNAPNDDMVDQASQALIYMAQNGQDWDDYETE